jgi:hypothetical protein
MTNPKLKKVNNTVQKPEKTSEDKPTMQENEH